MFSVALGSTSTHTSKRIAISLWKLYCEIHAESSEWKWIEIHSGGPQISLKLTN